MARRALSLMSAAAVVAGTALVVTPVSPASAASNTVTACVKKKTGEVRVLKKASKKCKKGWKKVSWNKVGAPGTPGTPGATGPGGNTGARGPQYIVTDGTGATVGNLIGVFPFAPFPVLSILSSDGLYTYFNNGKVFGQFSPKFTDSECLLTAYVQPDSVIERDLATGMAGSPARLVYRPDSFIPNTVRAWSYTTTVSDVVNQPLFDLDDAGTCQPDGNPPFTGQLVALQKVDPPSDRTPPLTITTN